MEGGDVRQGDECAEGGKVLLHRAYEQGAGLTAERRFDPPHTDQVSRGPDDAQQGEQLLETVGAYPFDKDTTSSSNISKSKKHRSSKGSKGGR